MQLVVTSQEWGVSAMMRIQLLTRMPSHTKAFIWSRQKWGGIYLIGTSGRTDILSEVAACCKQIEQRGIDITDGYDQWLKVGCSLATLGEDGRDFFHLCSQQSMDYNESKTDKMFSDLLKRNYQNINIGTFFWLCKQNGILMKWKLRWKSMCLHQTKQVSEIIARRKAGWNLIRFEQ